MGPWTYTHILYMPGFSVLIYFLLIVPTEFQTSLLLTPPWARLLDSPPLWVFTCDFLCESLSTGTTSFRKSRTLLILSGTWGFSFLDTVSVFNCPCCIWEKGIWWVWCRRRDFSYHLSLSNWDNIKTNCLDKSRVNFTYFMTLL